MKAHGRPIEELDKCLGEDMLPGMLLHMIGTAGGVDPPMNRAGNLFSNNMDHIAAAVVFNAIDDRHIVEHSEIIGLAARRWIERSPVENKSDFISDGFG